MKAVFFHDTRLKVYNDIAYTSGGVTNNYLQRYLKFFSKITLCTREENIETENEIKRLSICSGNRIELKGIKNLNLNSLLFGRARDIIRNNVKNNDFLIIRLPSFIGILACIEARIQKKEYLIEMVGCPWDSLWNYGKTIKKLVAPIFTLLNKYEVKIAPNVIYVTSNFLQNRYPSKGNCIGCSDVNIENIDNENLEKRIKKIEIKDKNKDNIYKLGIIGSLNVNYKGHKTAIQALSKLKKEINFELHFLGNGDKNKWIKIAKKYGIEDKLIFDGVLPHNEVSKWIDDIDIYLIPSLTEGMPRALIEVMSRACPAIGTKAGGIPELLEKEMLIKKKDYKKLAKKIMQLINDKEIMKSFASINFNKSLNFEKCKLEGKRNAFYENLLKERKFNV